MRLPLLYDALMEFENAMLSGDGRNLLCRCPFCGGSTADRKSFSIKVDPDPGEPIFFQCYRMSCGKKGVLKTNTLEQIGIRDKNVRAEVAAHNQTVSPTFDKPFVEKQARDYTLINLPTGNGLSKLKYINKRLGTALTVQDLSNLKIQLSLLDMLRLNDIKKLAVGQNKARLLDVYCIGFISMYRDYMICRDVTPDLKSGARYYTYRISGRPDPNDLRIYAIPGEVDVMSPKSLELNVAEGPFSILGAYLNTELGNEKPNSVWLANCGSQYTNTIMKFCKQYGFLKVRINIWSDSEIELGYYQKLYKELKNRLDIRRMVVYYNGKKEDFGHSKKDIDIHRATIYGKDD